MKKLIPLILLCSCSRGITGTVTEVDGHNVTFRVVNVYIYRLNVDSIPGLGDTITLKRNMNHKKINARLL